MKTWDFISNFIAYQKTMEELRPPKRTMLLWSAVSLAYVFGNVHITSGTASIQGIEFSGLSDTKMLIFLFLSTAYYLVRWWWIKHLSLRAYKEEGFIDELWKFGAIQRYEKDEVSEELDLSADYRYASIRSYQIDKISSPFTELLHNPARYASLREMFRSTPSSMTVSYIEHILLPHYIPAVIAGLALLALIVRLCQDC